MTHARQMMEANPNGSALDTTALVECVEACFDCAQACTACADACLGEQDIQMLIRCIRLDLDCAEMCDATGKILSRQTAFDAEIAKAILQACAQACRLCGEECEQHAQHGMEHCLPYLRRGLPSLRKRMRQSPLRGGLKDRNVKACWERGVGHPRFLSLRFLPRHNLSTRSVRVRLPARAS